MAELISQGAKKNIIEKSGIISEKRFLLVLAFFIIYGPICSLLHLILLSLSLVKLGESGWYGAPIYCHHLQRSWMYSTFLAMLVFFISLNVYAGVVYDYVNSPLFCVCFNYDYTDNYIKNSFKAKSYNFSELSVFNLLFCQQSLIKSIRKTMINAHDCYFRQNKQKWIMIKEEPVT